MLKDNLVRQGVDLSFETNLLYLDVNNLRVGINQSVPTVLLDVNGTAKFGNVQISTNTISSSNTNGNLTLSPNGTGNVLLNTASANSVVYAGANKELLTSSNLTFDGTTVTIATGNLTTLNAGNIQTSGNTIASSNTNGNINLSPNGTGNIIVTPATASRIFYSGTNKELITNANLTFDGSTIVLTGSANLSNIRISGSTISSTATNSNITLTPNGTGNVIVSTATAARVFYAGSSKELTTSANLTFDGTNLTVSGITVGTGGTTSLGNISISGNTISSTNTNGNINIDPAGTGQVIIPGTNAVNVPNGTTVQRPTGTAGDIRVNTQAKTLEFFDGTNWNSLQGISPVVTNSFSGDGVTSAFTLTQSSTTAGTIVSINGVLQIPDTAYSITGTTLTFLETPLAGDVIDARLLSTAMSFSSLSDNTTSVSVSDSTQTANVTIHGNVVTSIGNAGITFYQGTISSVSSTSVGAATVTIDSFSPTSFSAAKYIIHVSNGLNTQVAEVLLTHDGTTPKLTTYAVVFTNTQLMTFSTTISGGNVLLQGTGVSAGNSVKVSRHLII